MRDLRELDRWRRRDRAVTDFFGWAGDEHGGVFDLPFEGRALRVIATVGDGWDHVSVSLQTRCPKWEEMDWVKRRFFLPHETAMQLHVPVDDHVNLHSFCLHLWRPLEGEVVRPPASLVGGAIMPTRWRA